MKEPTAPRQQTSFSLDVSTLEEWGQLRGVTCEGNAISLDDMLLVEDDAPGIGRPEGAEDRSWFERLHRGVVMRKNLVLDDERCQAAHLLFCGLEKDNNDHPLNLRVNGHELTRLPSKVAHPFARQYYTSDWGGAHFDNWFVIQVPVGALQQGDNEILLWADSEETSWEIMVAAGAEYERGSDERQSHPRRSARSQDGGDTWDSGHLGWKGEIDGEYCVRLSLDRYAAEGVYTSPVIDLTGEEEPVARRVDLGPCCVEWDLDVPPDCDVDIAVRLGDSPVLREGGWSQFEAVQGEQWQSPAPAGRYLQFRAELRSGNPLVTPRLSGVCVTAMVEGDGDLSGSRGVMEWENGQVVRPSREFVHEDFSKLGALRERFDLDRVVEGAATEFEAQLRLMRWAYKVPIGRLDPYSWRYEDLPQVNADGHPEMQGEYEGRRRDGHCLHCNLTLIAACLAMGYPARWVNISTKHLYGHEVTEVWSNDYNGWIFLDATRDYYIYDPDTGVPMGLAEINERLAEIMPGPATWEYPIQWRLPDDAMAQEARVAYRQGDNRVAISDPSEGPHHLMLKGHLQMPLRNDFASRPHPVPWRLSSNWGGDQFLCYYAEMFPRKREYQSHTNRWQDFSPLLNQSELFLSETAEPGLIRVDVDTETPCFDTFLVQMDEGGWLEQRAMPMEWSLHEGLNHLRVRTRNRARICGPVSHVSIAYNQ